jgi:hypothetical protein
MRPKQVITALLLVFVVGSLGFVLVQERGSGSTSPSEVGGDDVREDQVVAYYFHGKARCATCQKLESYAHEALKTGFSQELATDRLTWRIVDTSLPENRHFLTDYQLQYQAVVLVETKDGQQRWRNLDQIWQKVGDKEEYIAYVQGEVDRFLAE